MKAIHPQELRAALRAHERAIALHLYDPDVTLIDVGLKIHEEADQQLTDQLVVRVHRRYKPRGLAFEAFAARQPERVVDAERIGFPVDIIQADYRLQFFQPPPASPRARLYNPLQGGISISSELSYGYGTLGGMVRDRDNGDAMILSNWHVLAGSDRVERGLRIYQPGYGDLGGRQHTIAALDRHAMHVNIDAAVARLSTDRATLNDQLDVGPVTGIAAPELGMRILKSGRGSNVTQGVISGLAGVRTIPYGRYARQVHHVVHIMQTPERKEVSAPGDSGSWWLDADNHRVVGLHFAGDNEPEYGLAISMPEVLDALNVDPIL